MRAWRTRDAALGAHYDQAAVVEEDGTSSNTHTNTCSQKRNGMPACGVVMYTHYTGGWWRRSLRRCRRRRQQSFSSEKGGVWVVKSVSQAFPFSFAHNATQLDGKCKCSCSRNTHMQKMPSTQYMFVRQSISVAMRLLVCAPA